MTQDIETRPQQPQAQSADPVGSVPPTDPPAQPAEPARTPGFFRRHPAAIFIVLIFLALAVAGGLWLWNYVSSYEDTDDAQMDGHIYTISPRVSGRVTAVNFDNNQLINQGQVVVQLDPTDYEVALNHAKADLQESEATASAAVNQVPITTTSTSSQLSTAQAGVLEATAAISVAQQQQQAAQARIQEAQANYVKAQKDVERYRPLVEKQEISQQQFDQAVATADALSATVQTARANAEAASRQIAQAQARLEQARAEESSTRSSPQQIAAQRSRAAASQATAAASRADVLQNELNLKYTIITAPIAGVIGQRSVEVGQQVSAGQPLMAVVPLNDLWVTANFKETQVKHMRVGQRATIKIDATDQTYKGHVDSFPGATGARYSLLPPENATGNYVKVVQRLPVKIVLEQGEDPNHLLRPGMSAEPKVWLR